MPIFAIRTENLGKRYSLGSRLPMSNTFRETLSQTLTRPAAFLRRAFSGRPVLSNRPPDTIWALRQLSLTVDEGVILGVVGRNGAGKTTLLKILSRITNPTEGKAEIRGKVGSLLEVGTGFHGELTGRENIYLNAAILGMKRSEVDRKFDQIVDFAGVERFIDTPIKRYSSGMALRLGFAVAAHLEPEILLIDEVLAVGDLEFQRRCLGKMSEVTKEGRTVLFVSHNLYAVQTICTEAIWIESGQLHARGEVNSVISQYQIAMDDTSESSREAQDRDSDEASIGAITVDGKAGRYITLKGPTDLQISWELSVRRPITVSLGVSLSSADGTYLSGLATGLEGRIYKLLPGEHTAGIVFPNLSLRSGVYVVRISVMNEDGSHSYSYRSPAVTLYAETPFDFDGILKLSHTWAAITSHPHGNAEEIRRQ